MNAAMTTAGIATSTSRDGSDRQPTSTQITAAATSTVIPTAAIKSAGPSVFGQGAMSRQSVAKNHFQNPPANDVGAEQGATSTRAKNPAGCPQVASQPPRSKMMEFSGSGVPR